MYHTSHDRAMRGNIRAVAPPHIARKIGRAHLHVTFINMYINTYDSSTCISTRMIHQHVYQHV